MKSGGNAGFLRWRRFIVDALIGAATLAIAVAAISVTAGILYILPIVGALVGSWLLPQLGVRIGSGFLTKTIVATLGAVLVLFVVGLIWGGFPGRRWRF